ncbi:glycoside hydrolase family 125 protein, partial [Plebeiibacterium sediminum]|nr:glycoside hydrolase family 125 protein [Plebeiobacterium sediminum]
MKKKFFGLKACLILSIISIGELKAHDIVMPVDNTNVAVKVKEQIFQSQRPAKADRLFVSKVIDKEIFRIKKLLTNAKLAWMFENCFPNTLDTTVRYRKTD